MTKRHRNAPGPGHYKVQGHPVEDSDVAASSKQALEREAARRKERVGRKKAAVTAPRQAVATPQSELPPTPPALERVHDRELANRNDRERANRTDRERANRNEREFAKMNERTRGKRVKPSAPAPGRGYLGATARGVIRRVARMAMAPLSLARAVVDRLRDRD
jgi:hypothetical protein